MGMLKPPEVSGRWILPSQITPAIPLWGHAEGIQVGLHPLQGPRGLIRIFAPYLGSPHDKKLLNFVAVEPIPVGDTKRGFSELEWSMLDRQPGKRFWSANSRDDTVPGCPEAPARGVIATTAGVERLTVQIFSETFENGAKVALEVSFRADRSHEVSFATFALPGSVDLDYCILTATMGNYPRLRKVQLAERTVSPSTLWPDFNGNEFTEHASFARNELARTLAGDVTVTAAPDESNPESAVYASNVAEHWRYRGRRASQTWAVSDPSPEIELLLNARSNYWASTAPIPGGPSFENFELREPYIEGKEFRFSIEQLD